MLTLLNIQNYLQQARESEKEMQMWTSKTNVYCEHFPTELCHVWAVEAATLPSLGNIFQPKTEMLWLSRQVASMSIRMGYRKTYIPVPIDFELKWYIV